MYVSRGPHVLHTFYSGSTAYAANVLFALRACACKLIVATKLDLCCLASVSMLCVGKQNVGVLLFRIGFVCIVLQLQ